MENKIALYIFSLILFVGGICIIIGSIFLINKSNYYKENGILIEATVIEITNVYSSHTDNGSRTNYVADIEYVVNNNKYKSEYKTTHYIKKGDLVEIYYDKNKPEENWHTTSNIGPIIMMIMGIICFSVGLIFLIFIRKNKV